MMIAVIVDRIRMRRRAVSNVRSTASPNRASSRGSWPNAWTTFIAPSTSAARTPTIATRSWLLREARRRRPPNTVIGPTTQRDADQQFGGQRGGHGEQIDDAADRHDRVAQRDRHGGADDLFDDRGIRCQARGDFLGAVFLEKAGRHAHRLACTFMRTSATTRSPSQDTK